jgi:undecaprenyl-diphosphatase
MDATPHRVRRDGDLLRSPSRALAVGIAMFAAAGVLTVLVAVDPGSPPLLGGIDRAWGDLALDVPSWLESASRALKVLGSGLVLVPLRIAVAMWLAWRRRRYDLAAWLLAWALADLLTFVLKPAIDRVRPDGSDATSFPSAHAKSAAQVAFGLVLVFTSPWRPRTAWWLLAVAWTLAMSVSRTVLDEHWLSDVAAGSLLGAGCAIAVAAVVQLRRPSLR